MSYSRRYHERIAVPYSGSTTVSYPPSEHGGTKTVYYDGTTYEDINVNIDVDTSPFDSNIVNCNSSVNCLTGAVVATETAQIESIQRNSKKVANTIVTGFFDYIRSDISQQIMELSQKIDSHLIHLREMAKNCIGKQKQMEVDYNRISSRYVKIFDDLNNELENRIFALDEPAFKFKRNTHSNKTCDSDLLTTVIVFGKEGSELQSTISASKLKKRALNTIYQANIFLLKQKKMQSLINKSMIKECTNLTRFVPVCFVELNNDKSQITRNLFHSDFLEIPNQNKLIENFKLQHWEKGKTEHLDHIKRYFNTEIINIYKSSNQHNERVKNMLVKISNLNSIQFV